MLAAFPSPVLVLTADAVRDLEGGEALSGLWALFTKCKESLQDGRRLENISWRLWYREMSQSHSYRPPTPDSSSAGLSDSSSECIYFEPSEKKEQGMVHHHLQYPLTANKIISPPSATLEASSMSSAHPSSVTSNRSLTRIKSHSSVGKMMLDILPNKVVPRTKPAKQVADTQATIPAVRLPSTPPSAPRVVVVNPTPHPTPPATPVLPNTEPSMPETHIRSTHLLPPLPPPALSRRQQPDVQLAPPAAKHNDETLKPSDRRFFLQQQTTDQESAHDGSSDGGKPSSVGQASSATSSHVSTKADLGAKRNPPRGARKTKEAGRHAARPTMQRVHSHASKHQTTQRKVNAVTHDAPAPKTRPAFNVGSTSSNGSKSVSGTSGSKDEAPPAPKPRTASPPKVSKASTTAQRRRIVVSSEYDTDDTDDDSWASEDMSAEENEKSKDEAKLREAALEAQRQRDLFAKVPKRSYSNLNRTRSGLLSALLNPDPSIFPPNHPYRTSFSSQDITQLSHDNPSRVAPPPMHTSKSAAVLPQAAQVNAAAQQPTAPGQPPRTGYRPRGRPQDQELEDESDSDTENPDDKIQVSRSVAQQKLAALAGRRTSADRGAPARPHQPPLHQQYLPQRHQLPQPAPTRPSLPSVSTAPIPFGHPYNLPAPAAPSTPRTTRRQMLATELSESLRRNLLWERQVSKVSMMGGVRRQASASGVLGGGIRPLTSTNGAPANGNANGNAGPANARLSAEEDLEERKRRSMARNRSWGTDFHYSGW